MSFSVRGFLSAFSEPYSIDTAAWKFMMVGAHSPWLPGPGQGTRGRELGRGCGASSYLEVTLCCVSLSVLKQQPFLLAEFGYSNPQCHLKPGSLFLLLSHSFLLSVIVCLWNPRSSWPLAIGHVLHCLHLKGIDLKGGSSRPLLLPQTTRSCRPLPGQGPGPYSM